MTDLKKIPPRLPDWRARLADYAAASAQSRFRPGAHDCALFVSGAIEAMTGFDPGADYRGTYRDLEAGRAMLEDLGFVDHVALVADLLPEIPPALAKPGDVAVLPGEGGAALGIFQGAGVYCLQPSGLAVVSRLEVEKAFSV